jgi:hypothetical protein
MAVKKQQANTHTGPGRKPGTISSKTSRKCRTQTAAPGPVGRKPRPKSTSQPQPNPANQPGLKHGEAASRLLGEINDQVALDCTEIVRAVVEKAIRGDMNGFRLLADLTGAKAQSTQPPKKAHRQILPWRADDLAADPEWQAPRDPEVDTGEGGREPEA